MSLAGVTGAVSIAQGRPWPTSVNVSITPMAYLTAGLIAWRRRPDNLTGPLLMTAAIPSLLALVRYLLPVLAALEAGLYSGSIVILAYVLLAFPTGRLTGRAERRAIGLIALAYGGITYTKREKVLDLGPIQATAERQKTIPFPPILGGICLVGGIVLVIVGNRTA